MIADVILKQIIATLRGWETAIYMFVHTLYTYISHICWYCFSYSRTGVKISQKWLKIKHNCLQFSFHWFPDMRNDYYQLAVCDNDTCTDCGVIPRSNQGEWSLVKCDLLGDQVVLRKVVASVFQLVEVDIHGYSKFITPYIILITY